MPVPRGKIVSAPSISSLNENSVSKYIIVLSPAIRLKSVCLYVYVIYMKGEGGRQCHIHIDS